MSRVVVARCPAKVNLSLRILGRRADGYHELDTVFQAIDVRDRLEAAPAGELSLLCDDPRLARDDTNLVLRAARALREHHGVREGARLRLRKRIPIEAGLGGGSSDAAAALLVCARLWELDVPPAELSGVARHLGADVPFFLVGGTARGTGRGDRIERLPFFGERPILLGIAPFGLRTAEVFDRASRRLTLPGNGVSVGPRPGPKLPQDNDFGLLVNDLEGVVFEGWPELACFRDALLGAGARWAGLSGSGSTVFGVFHDRATAAGARRALTSRFPAWRLLGTRAVAGGVEVLARE